MALPTATFLTQVVTTIPSNVRIDLGYRGSRDFLQSGLHAAPAGSSREEASSIWATGRAKHLDEESVPPAGESHEMKTQQFSTSFPDPLSPQSSLPAVDPATSDLEAHLTESLLLSEGGPTGGSSASLFILSAMTEAHKAQPTVGVAPQLSSRPPAVLPYL